VETQDLTAGVTGFDPNLPVMLTSGPNGSATLAVGGSQQPTFTASFSGIVPGTQVSVVVDSPAQQQQQQSMLQVTQPTGRVVQVILVQFPQGTQVGLNLGNSQQIVSSVTSQTGQALAVDIRTEDSGGNITFTITYHAPTSQGLAKTIYLAPGGSMTIAASGVPQNGIYQLAFSYGSVPLGRTAESELRLMKVADDRPLQAISSSDCGNQSQTSTLGDYGVDTTAKKVWANVDTLGTFAIGVPKTPVEVITTTIAL
jgi:hypothetical protein